jgi:hypothetical protein
MKQGSRNSTTFPRIKIVSLTIPQRINCRLTIPSWVYQTSISPAEHKRVDIIQCKRCNLCRHDLRWICVPLKEKQQFSPIVEFMTKSKHFVHRSSNVIHCLTFHYTMWTRQASLGQETYCAFGFCATSIWSPLTMTSMQAISYI